jgi:hypothetical protein
VNTAMDLQLPLNTANFWLVERLLASKEVFFFVEVVTSLFSLSIC